MDKKFITYKDVLKKFKKKQIDITEFHDAVKENCFTTYAMHPIQKELRRFKIISVDPDTDEIDGYFLDS